MTIPREEIETRLISEYGYHAREASSAAAKLDALQKPLQEPFYRWWTTGELPDMSVEGYTVQQLIASRGMSPPAAFLALDWLLRQPVAARAALQRRVDHVEVSDTD